ncbi:MAG: hypothetical protein HUJ93_06425, partial [Bacteroidales bacterium]|nr:hypothetical protein [Bacteroidales bacterium]
MKKSLFLLSMMTICLPAVAQTEKVSDIDYFRNEIRIISSDEFGGRKPMSEYEPITINH